jgi:hypothetical protein
MGEMDPLSVEALQLLAKANIAIAGILSPLSFVLAVVPVDALVIHEWRRFCRSHDLAEGLPATVGEREEVVVARNVKGLCIYALRDHATYGHLIDVPFFIASSAADGEGWLRNFPRGKWDQSVCSGIRFWTMDSETWAHRLRPDYIARSDHRLFPPAFASTAGVVKALRADAFSVTQAIDRLSR